MTLCAKPPATPQGDPGSRLAVAVSDAGRLEILLLAGYDTPAFRQPLTLCRQPNLVTDSQRTSGTHRLQDAQRPRNMWVALWNWGTHGLRIDEVDEKNPNF